MKTHDSKFYTYTINQLLQLVYMFRKAKKEPERSIEDISKEFNIPSSMATDVINYMDKNYHKDKIYSDDLSFQSLIGENKIRTQSISKINNRRNENEILLSVRDFSTITSQEFFGLHISVNAKLLFLSLMADNKIAFKDGDMNTVNTCYDHLKALVGSNSYTKG